ncbi:hypothetical protein [Winogradskyella haliclonae]|uniref:Uncharacterized protein n=1 Tax=Winogradskyella haliclonae TaxID=2048558 RepID=A0ABQ2C0D9_9FLAO|nr:hypothetical protein [Winogradskyella haliclonae]GGI58202.1 hypothetical protein GCM10011444_25110 [Winogradskyella haliclonae]
MTRRILLLLFICLGLSLYGQSKKHTLPLAKFGENLSKPLSSKERAFIDEVYGAYANEFIYNKPHRVKTFKQILRNRVKIGFYENKDLSSLKRLSQIPLVNSINHNLLRDFSFDADNFNPLKYAFNFFSENKTQTYRVDNTQFVITIFSQH